MTLLEDIGRFFLNDLFATIAVRKYSFALSFGLAFYIAGKFKLIDEKAGTRQPG